YRKRPGGGSVRLWAKPAARASQICAQHLQDDLCVDLAFQLPERLGGQRERPGRVPALQGGRSRPPQPGRRIGAEIPQQGRSGGLVFLIVGQQRRGGVVVVGRGGFRQGGGRLQLFAAGGILSRGQHRADPPLQQLRQ